MIYLSSRYLEVCSMKQFDLNELMALKQQRDVLLQEITSFPPFRVGSINKRTNPKSSSDEYTFTHKKDGKTVTRSIPEKNIELAKTINQRYALFTDLIRRYTEVNCLISDILVRFPDETSDIVF